jgi:lysophospholipase L1-like esterase
MNEVALHRLHQRLAADAPITWVFTGDSITHGARHTNGWRSYVEHFHERVRWELRRTSDCVVNTGVSGDDVHAVRADFEHRVARFRPDVVCVMLGTNDALSGPSGRVAFRNGIGALVSRVFDAGAIPLLQTPPAIAADAVERADLPGYVDELRDVARQCDVSIVDHFGHWNEHRWGPELRSDEIHPNARGHVELARKLFIELGIFDPSSATCALSITA